jgi:hypothetical protein
MCWHLRIAAEVQHCSMLSVSACLRGTTGETHLHTYTHKEQHTKEFHGMAACQNLGKVTNHVTVSFSLVIVLSIRTVGKSSCLVKKFYPGM